MDIYSFGEQGEDKWYAGIDGKRVKCAEEVIDYLWWKWIVAEGTARADDGKYTIFTIKEPIVLDDQLL